MSAGVVAVFVQFGAAIEASRAEEGPADVGADSVAVLEGC